jgi:hypothetical protein
MVITLDNGPVKQNGAPMSVWQLSHVMLTPGARLSLVGRSCSSLIGNLSQSSNRLLNRQIGY